MKTNRLLPILLLCCLSSLAIAEEIIHSFHSEIDVRKNGDLYVTETIVVTAEGRNIRRGIYRDFPTIYSDERGLSKQIGFEVLSVMRDGKPEDYSVQNKNNGKRVYVGNKNRFLSKGVYEYQISYLTTRQLGFFDDFDELYWNVTGTGWVFPIEQASARLTLPSQASEFRLTGYTGVQGSTEKNLSAFKENSRQVYFETTRALDRRQGLTIVAGWPKGIVSEPDAAQLREYFFNDNRHLIIGIFGACLLFIYYCLIWWRVGRDPAGGIVVPLYTPPGGYSPASMRFVENMDYDNKCFTAAIINLAVKGALSINDTDGDFLIEKTSTAREKLAAGEQGILNALFKGRSSITIEQSEHTLLGKAIRKHKRSLQKDYEKRYFVSNAWYLAPGIGITLLTIGLAMANIHTEETLAATIMMSVVCFVPIFAIVTAIRRIKQRKSRAIMRLLIVVVSFAIFGNFIAGVGANLEKFITAVPWPLVIAIITMLWLNYFFHGWLKAPTLAGRKLLDQIAGFKHYLEVAESDEIQLQKEPVFTTDIYERYLPYAIALNLENAWTARLDHAVAKGAIPSTYRQPNWYHRRGSRRSQHFSESLAQSMNSAISSSSVAPGSSSGSSGGSSGGGGGGGGGGGW